MEPAELERALGTIVALVVTPAVGARSPLREELERLGLFVIDAPTDDAVLAIARTLALDVVLLHDVDPDRARALLASLRGVGQTATVIACAGPDLRATLVDVVVSGRRGASA